MSFCSDSLMIGDMYKNIPAATEDERNCSGWLGILGESNLSQDNTDVMLACLKKRRGREGEKRQLIKSS
jgi:hypothetical protein